MANTSGNTMRRQPQFGRYKHVHMVGIGGIGMSSIALVLLNRGYTVTGSDLAETETTRLLVSRGATVFKGHDASNVGDADVVVYSSAVQPDANVETMAAERERIPIIKRSVMLGELMRMKFGIGIAGTHGKTTTTSLTGLVVSEGNFDPTIIVGGKVTEFGSNAMIGEGDIIVIEADEYDRTFLRLTPSLAVITNIDTDHLDIYSGLDDIKNSFVQYANSVPFFGAAILCIDDANVQDIVDRIDRRVITFGISRQADVRAENIVQKGIESQFDVFAQASRLGRVSLQLPGRHNILNALAAVTVGLELDIGFDEIKKSLGGFRGVQRRFEILADTGDVIVVNDYAHHPSEISSTLEAAVDCWPDDRVVGVFQPHLYSRTADLKEEFARSFFDADVALVTSIYGAREEPIEGVEGSIIVDLARKYGHQDIRYVGDMEGLTAALDDLVESGDRVIFMGAGDIWRTATAYAETVSREVGG